MSEQRINAMFSYNISIRSFTDIKIILKQLINCFSDIKLQLSVINFISLLRH